MSKTWNRLNPFRKNIPGRSTALFFLFSVVGGFQFSQLHAQDSIQDSLVINRIQYIQTKLDEGKPVASLWWNAWLYGYTAATVAQGAVFATSESLKTRQDLALGAATTALGAVGQLLMPMVPVYAPKRLALMPGDTPEERIQKLKKAEELFEASSAREKEGRSWKVHAVSGAINVSTGLVTWLGFDRTVQSGLIAFAINTAITEVQIFTQPTRAIRDYNEYCEKYKAGLASALVKPKPHWFLNAYPGGLSLRMTFR
jgi:hypothetical protein